ncbi:MAG: hypothetical protein ACJ790_22280 [Myxococcaceae bacterium]
MFTQISVFLGYFRWLFMPLGLFALIAIGVHAAADTVDDRIRFLVEQWDAWADSLLGQFDSTARFVDWIGAEERTVIARALTLVWELACDFFIAFPAFGYMEEESKPNVKRFRITPSRGWKELFRAVVKEPTTMRIVRPIATASLVVAGACAVGRMVQSSFYLTLRQPLTDEMAGSFARLLAVAAIVGVLASFGVRAVLRNLQHADEVAQKDRARSKALALTRGLIGTCLVVPLAVAAFTDASPLLSFLR